MRLRSFILSICLMVAAPLAAQQLEIIEADPIVSSLTNAEVKANLKLVNKSKNKVQVFAQKTEVNSLVNEQLKLCIYNECFVFQGQKFIYLGQMEPGEVWEEMSLTMYTGNKAGMGEERIVFTESPNSGKQIEWILKQNIISSNSKNDLLNTKELIAGQIFPNPADNIVNLTYEIKEPRTKAKMMIFNMLGSQIGEYILEETNSHLKINTSHLPPGVYFYSIYVNGNNQITKKLIVKR
jgi:hypothetical protein